MIKQARRIEIRTIDEYLCIGCRACIDSCMMDVIYFDEEKDKAYPKYPSDCQACFMCVKDCPVEAITIDAVNQGGGI
jgi:NAD-dependent dihydropyrimidine dehydrogenase PreA subunit